MIGISLGWRKGTLVWANAAAPLEFKSGLVAWAAGVKSASSNTERYELTVPSEAGCPLHEYQTSTIHGRSCYLGVDEAGYNYFAKGIGWVLSDGWKPSFDNLGILPMWAALRERDVANTLHGFGLDVVEPIAITQHELIPHIGANEREYVRADSIKDLDGSEANPVMYVYRTRARWRIADLMYMPFNMVSKTLRNDGNLKLWLEQTISTISKSVATVHRFEGHDHTLSPHNIFTSGTRVDFEYVALNGLPHPDPNLQRDKNVWVNKELFSLKLLSWELNEFLKIGYGPDEIDLIISKAYTGIHDHPLPY